ncbi:unnamed protein product [Leptidea sinapis]|uniref:Odorant receptor n=1 Tax=Leptidea sinapis TaxID=189913 RepID=A0A5E4QAB4_9NEOP|nr:unnamed protein product [Leptidea sinapis]
MKERRLLKGNRKFKHSIKLCNRRTNTHLCIFFSLTLMTTLGWAGSGLEHYDRHLPLRACHAGSYWLPASTSAKIFWSPRSWRSAGVGCCSSPFDSELCRLNENQERRVRSQLGKCVREHQDVLRTVALLQDCFSEPTFAQFTVSLVIICVTAFQLVFSENISRAAYEFPWYTCSVGTRRSLLIMVTRCRRIAKLTAAGFTTLSLASFMSILKASYTFFTVLHLCSIWGDIQLMTATAFVLFTNITHTTKIINFLVRASRIKAIVDNNCRVLRSEDSAVGRKLVKRYPFDTTRSPAYQLAFAHQSTALYLSAMMNISKDTVVITLIAQCRCRLLLLSQALRRQLLNENQERRVRSQLGKCVREHQDVLRTVSLLQDCFSEPTFAQFTVSLVIICVTAFQLQTGKPVRMLSMACYLLNMLCQVFIYCYEGNELSIESENISRAAYEFPWYTSSVDTRRSVLIMMTRCCRIAKLTAAGFTTLSLASFMSICKASYSFFTVLKQVEEENY